MSERSKNLLVDVAALAVYAVAANPALTGIGFHEWVSLGVLVAFLAHVALHMDWMADVFKTALRHPSVARTGNLVLDALILVAVMTCAVSGIMVSGDVLPAFGLYAEGYYFWGPLHAASAKLVLALLLVHVVVHWRWIASFVKKKDAEHAEHDRSDN